jgi:hypothetical protein
MELCIPNTILLGNLSGECIVHGLQKAGDIYCRQCLKVLLMGSLSKAKVRGALSSAEPSKAPL